MNKMIFFGDSNTYGYDPRDYSGGEYPKEVIWTYKVAEAFSDRFEVVNEGLNGRRIPSPGQYGYVSSLLNRLGENDIFAVMLGTNDIMMTLVPNAGIAVNKMEQFIKWLLERESHPKLLLIAPPYAGREDAADLIYRTYHRECIKMNRGFRDLAKKYGIMFADAGSWDIELAFDMGHFTEKGHKVFAEYLIRSMRAWTGEEVLREL